MDEAYDCVIVGGGAAGCVLANRLSAHPGVRVALVEAGPDTSPDTPDPVLWDSYPIIAYFDPRYHWTDLRVRLHPPRNGVESEPRRYEQARVMGGGTSINGMMANRGAPSDYDEWASLGAEGWSADDVLPYFKRLEWDIDFGGPAHGDNGPMPIRRVPREAWPVYPVAAAGAMRSLGFPWVEDQNEDFSTSCFPKTVTNLYDRRVSTATAYLDPKTRRRTNLTILPKTRVANLTIEGRKVTGVEVVGEEGGRRRFGAGEVVLAAGALHSPALLMRAGIGPGEHLREMGLPVVADRPGVGGNLYEHPLVSVSAYISPEVRLPDSQRRHIHLGLRYSSGVEGCPEHDMYAVAVNKMAWHPLGLRLGGFLLWVNKTFSTGRVSLLSPDANKEPRVDFDLLADGRDAERLKGGVRLIARLFEQPPLRRVSEAPFPTSYSERVRDLATVTAANRRKTAILGRMLDGPKPLRDLLIRRVISDGTTLGELLRDDSRLEEWVRNSVTGVWHASGSCRMGRPDDPEAVVDAAGRVIGVEGLRVADASVMPTIPCANTMIPTIMIAEKMSDAILEDVARTPAVTREAPGAPDPANGARDTRRPDRPTGRTTPTTPDENGG